MSGPPLFDLTPRACAIGPHLPLLAGDVLAGLVAESLVKGGATPLTLAAVGAALIGIGLSYAEDGARDDFLLALADAADRFERARRPATQAALAAKAAETAATTDTDAEPKPSAEVVQLHTDKGRLH